MSEEQNVSTEPLIVRPLSFQFETHSLREAREANDGPAPEEKTFEGVEGVREAAQEISDQRPSDPIIEYGAGDGQPISAKDAADDLALSRQVGLYERLRHEASLDHKGAIAGAAYIGAHIAAHPVEPTLVMPELDEYMTAEQARKAMSEWRSKVASEITGEDVADPVNQQQPADAQTTQQQEPAPEVKQAHDDFMKSEVERQARGAIMNTIVGVLSIGSSEFADIKTTADLQWLSANDPVRFAKFQTYTMQATAAAKAHQAISHHEKQMERLEWEKFAREQDAKFEAETPEFQDPETKRQFQQEALATLEDYGISRAEAAALYNGEQKIDFRDARAQRIFLDAIKLRLARVRSREVQQRPLRPVQRPGVRSSGPSNSHSDQIKSLERQLEDATGQRAVRLGAKLAGLRRLAK